MDRYKVARKEAKLAVTEAKTAAYGRMYEELGEKDGEQKRDWDTVLGELEHSESHRDFGYCRRIKVKEVVGAMRKMRRERATGLDKISGIGGTVQGEEEASAMVFIDMQKANDKVPREVL
nr:uncharacterized protein LOC108943039 [Nicotiana tomentosiformis]